MLNFRFKTAKSAPTPNPALTSHSPSSLPVSLYPGRPTNRSGTFAGILAFSHDAPRTPLVAKVLLVLPPMRGRTSRRRDVGPASSPSARSTMSLSDHSISSPLKLPPSKKSASVASSVVAVMVSPSGVPTSTIRR